MLREAILRGLGILRMFAILLVATLSRAASGKRVLVCSRRATEGPLGTWPAFEACTPWMSGDSPVNSHASCDSSAPCLTSPWGVQACWPQPPWHFGQVLDCGGTCDDMRDLLTKGSQPIYSTDGVLDSCKAHGGEVAASVMPTEMPPQVSLHALLHWQAKPSR